MSAVPYVRTGARSVRARGRAHAVSLADVVPWTTVWCAVCIASVLATNFVGNVALERCRQDTRQARARLEGARKSLARLQSASAALSAPQYLADWAKQRGFVEAGRSEEAGPAFGGGYVAFRR
ncbi:MAG: hypothetical protein WHU10_01990 [Fimbriimonadales bacterium]